MRWYALWWVMMNEAHSLSPLTQEPGSHKHRFQRQGIRRITQTAFFALFLLAPALDLLRFDLNETQLWFLGQRWTLGIDALIQRQVTPLHAAVDLILRGFLPLLLIVGGFMAVAYRYGRVYCGWLCPHFSLVETLNGMMHRALGRFSLWERSAAHLPGRQPNRLWMLPLLVSCVVFGFLWAITLLTYLLPPAEIWGHLIHQQLTDNQQRFLLIGTLVFSLEFFLARHLFCRFGCAVGLFQSLAWMANPKGMVVSFDRDRARECRSCDPPRGSACDTACPMRLHPRNIKRMMFSCVQCGQCLSACESSQSSQDRSSTLTWTVGLDAVRETLRQRRSAGDH